MARKQSIKTIEQAVRRPRELLKSRPSLLPPRLSPMSTKGEPLFPTSPFTTRVYRTRFSVRECTPSISGSCRTPCTSSFSAPPRRGCTVRAVRSSSDSPLRPATKLLVAPPTTSATSRVVKPPPRRVFNYSHPRMFLLGAYLSIFPAEV